MKDFFEIDFLAVETKKSGDAIPLRYEIDGTTYIHVVDGGFAETGETVVNHIKTYYGDPSAIDHVVVSHPDGDHTVGLRAVLEEFEVTALWMLRPWLYGNEIIDRFTRFTNVENLNTRLKELYPNIAALEEIATERGIPIYEPFQGAKIGAFTVLAPSKERYLDMVVQSDKTPETVEERKAEEANALKRLLGEAVMLFKAAAWGEEAFSSNDTSAENEMSIVQYANLCGKRILLTADTGREGLAEAADYAPFAGLTLPGIDRIQIPHHGSRRNVSTDVLDRWLGVQLDKKPAKGEETFTAICSSAKEDKDHPRKAVIRAFYHRGARVLATEGQHKRLSYNAPDRDGWITAESYPYPEDQEEE